MSEQPTDEVLMLRYKDGDLDAFEVLLERHQQQIFSFVMRFCRDYHTAQDLVQEVFLRIIKSAKSYEPRAKFTTFLFTCAHNICIDHLRRSKLRRAVSISDPIGNPGSDLTVADVMSDEKANPERDLHRQNFERALQQAVDQLPAEQREVFLLREQSHLQFEEIAKVVGCLPSTAKSRMRYALQSIREKLERQFSLADIA